MSGRTPDVKKRTLALVAEIDAEELACRIAEACVGLRRTDGRTGKAALDELATVAPDTVAGFRLAAVAAMDYVAQCIGKGQRPS